MIKVSFIIPVYNTYEYLEKCLESTVKQRANKYNFEIIIVNDGSTDESEKIILDYKNKYTKLIKYISKENGGVSSARNLGIEKSKGEYLYFLDSDDYLDLDFFIDLEKIFDNESPDVIRINSRDVKGNGELIKNVIIKPSDNDIELLKNIMKEKSLEVPWGYVFKKELFVKNNLKFLPQVHEDFGLIPIALYKANKIGQISNICYNYVERETSLTAEKNYEKLKKRVDDLYILYKNHMKEIKSDSVKGKLLRSYSLEALLNKLTTLNDEDMKKKLKEIKKDINPQDIYCYNLKKLIKRLILSINVNLYLNLYKKHKV